MPNKIENLSSHMAMSNISANINSLCRRSSFWRPPAGFWNSEYTRVPDWCGILRASWAQNRRTAYPCIGSRPHLEIGESGRGGEITLVKCVLECIKSMFWPLFLTSTQLFDLIELCAQAIVHPGEHVMSWQILCGHVRRIHIYRHGVSIDLIRCRQTNEQSEQLQYKKVTKKKRGKTGSVIRNCSRWPPADIIHEFKAVM